MENLPHVELTAELARVLLQRIMPKVDITVYFYTYSTIAQTLAGAFGFLVAVILYLIQGINRHKIGRAHV